MKIERDNIAGGIVRKKISTGGRDYYSGHHFTADEMLSWPRANLQSLMNAGYIEAYPKTPFGPAVKGDRFLVSRGPGKFDVVEGRRLNTQPLPHDEAIALRDQQ